VLPSQRRAMRGDMMILLVGSQFLEGRAELDVVEGIPNQLTGV
jgi:hypothetical protein